MSVLKIVSNDLTKEVHSVRIEDGAVSVVDIEDGGSISIEDMEELFPEFIENIRTSRTTEDVLNKLQASNNDFIWAHVSGKL